MRSPKAQNNDGENPLGTAQTAETPLRTEAAAAGENMRPLRILLVDDNEKNCILVQGFLRKAPYRIETAENGASGLEKFKSGQYDVVLMDIEMPVMDGYAASRAIRQWENEQGLAPTPIIALTAHAFSDYRQKSLAAGCSDHLSKPIRKESLLDIIARHACGDTCCGA